ncbi:hypothetical protein FP435_04775 [Lactobacillus sp. PV037]|uniref:hypothetical protein n=1 Tax=Lactobacillus sp. PV037 TaxID=2594496 RepID=UPI00223F7A8C|nr:hypothetical protein [Lactobacillus sp. PV037]QNQ83805.1 hypothetical protein FP435_04775 [Lactobacillus sp. PV037]
MEKFVSQVSDQVPYRDTYMTIKKLAKCNELQPLTMMRLLDVITLQAVDDPSSDLIAKYVLTLSDYVDRLVTKFLDHSLTGERALSERKIISAYLNDASEEKLLDLFTQLAKSNRNSLKDSYITFNSIHVMRYLFGMRDPLTVKAYKAIEKLEERMGDKWLL